MYRYPSPGRYARIAPPLTNQATSMPLSNKQIRHLRGLAHNLKPVVLLGQHGLTEAVMNEIEIALDHHELIKIKLSGERDEREEMRNQIVANTGAEIVQSIGRMVIIFKRNTKKPRVELPKG